MPSTRALATDQGLSRSTVVAAYEQLAIEGYLLVRQGAATIVAELRTSAPTTNASLAAATTTTTTADDRPLTPTGRQQGLDLRPGEPDSSLFPRAAWLRSLRRTITDAEDELFGYGDPLGHPSLRSALSEYLGRSRAVVARSEQISIFGGATASVAFLGEVFASRAITTVAMEDPGSFLLRRALELVGLEVVPIPMDDEGLVVDALANYKVGAVIVTPANQYPTGVTMSPARRNELLRWARERDAWIVEDDYDGEFRYDRQTIGSLQGLDPDRVLYIGTASKALSPGLRMSWMVAPDALSAPLAHVKHLRGAPSTVDQVALGDFIVHGELDRHLRQVRRLYDNRHQRIRAELTHVAPWLRLPAVEAGLHLAATSVGGPCSEQELVGMAEAVSIRLLGFGPHWHGCAKDEGIVFGFSRVAEHRFNEGMERLSTFLDSIEA